MKLSAADYWRLAKVYPLERRDEALYVSEQRRKEKMYLHLAKEQFGYLKASPLRDAVIILRGERLSLRKIAHILDVDIEAIVVSMGCSFTEFPITNEGGSR